MIDIHTHILPGIDDGARDLGDTLDMAALAADSGTTDLIATPHCHPPRGFENYADDAYRRVFTLAREAVERAGIPVKLHPGMEVFATPEVPELLRRGLLMPLNGSRYLLVEFDFWGDPDEADLLLRRIAAQGVVPVVAHIERYRFVQAYPQITREWKRRGYVIQCNKGSFQGRFGPDEYHLARHLMDRELVDVIASDAHRPYRRTPSLWPVYDQLALDYPESWLDELFTGNPGRILADKPL